MRHTTAYYLRPIGWRSRRERHSSCAGGGEVPPPPPFPRQGAAPAAMGGAAVGPAFSDFKLTDISNAELREALTVRARRVARARAEAAAARRPLSRVFRMRRGVSRVDARRGAPKRVVRGVCTTPPHTAFGWGRARAARDPGALRALLRSKIHGTHTLRGFRARGVRLEDASGVGGGRPFRSRT